MAKTTYSLIPAGFDFSFANALQSGDRFTFARYRRKLAFFSRRRRAGLTQKSLLPQIAVLWKNLSALEQQSWSAAGAICGLSGWRLFVSDTSLRIINDMSGVSIPSLLHQQYVGQLAIEAPANKIIIAQLHPQTYWISRKVTASKNQYVPVRITEKFSLPLTISLNYKSNLTAFGGVPRCRFYAIVYSSYQGLTRETLCEIPLDLSRDWVNASATIDWVIGLVRGYSLFFSLENVRGSLYVDNIRAEHSGQNWVRDPFCKDINQSFTKAFFQIPKHWAPVDLPYGSSFESTFLG